MTLHTSTTTLIHATVTMKAEQDILEILSLDLNQDWDWFEEAVISALKKHGIELSEDADFEPLNSRGLTLVKIGNWLNENRI